MITVIATTVRYFDSEDEELETSVIGPFVSHAGANGWMQKQYDQVKEQVEETLLSCDDSEASHFWIAGDDVCYHWQIVDMKEPS